jgi:(R)-2-hydroxyglutarate---pyruvate transhydrogenase
MYAHPPTHTPHNRLATSRPTVQVWGYGHLGDSNLHLNIAVPRHEPDPTDVLDAVLPWVMSHKGSVSAEHGLGQLKSKYLPLTKSAPVYELMCSIKAMLDPKGILQPGKFYGKDTEQQGPAGP